mmetsp:Transcript_30091/g.65019  ORF Transcript_30091/g.65019 Transcript_30091/m.65019 type:complete len:600 (-) Transcript_30091:214-2013(-)
MAPAPPSTGSASAAKRAVKKARTLAAFMEVRAPAKPDMAALGIASNTHHGVTGTGVKSALAKSANRSTISNANLTTPSPGLSSPTKRTSRSGGSSGASPGDAWFRNNAQPGEQRRSRSVDPAQAPKVARPRSTSKNQRSVTPSTRSPQSPYGQTFDLTGSSGYYSPAIVDARSDRPGNIRSRSQQRPLTGELAGAHYTRCGEELWDNLPDARKEEHDKMLADTIHKRRPSELPHPLLNEPRLAMKTAFTDRSARIRDGRGVKSTFKSDGDQTTDWGKDGKCDCDVCEPAGQVPSGNATHEVWYNKVPRCGRDSHPTPPTWRDEDFTTFDSAKMTSSLKHPLQNAAIEPQAEFTFTQSMGRRVRSSQAHPFASGSGRSGVLLHRSMSVDSLLAAGCYNVDHRPEISSNRTRGRQSFEGTQTDTIRSGVALAMSQRPGDPPAPTRITVHKRGDGVHKGGYSDEAVEHINYHNQDIFRFANSGFVRGRNTPALDYEGSGYRGLSTDGFRTRFERQSPASETPAKRPIIGNDSMIVSSVMDQETNKQLARQYSADRLKYDKAFTTMCDHTRDHLQTQRTLNAMTKSWCGLGSEGVSGHLVWEE